MRIMRVLVSIVLVFMITTSSVLAVNISQNQFEESNQVFEELSNILIDKAEKYVDGLMGVHFDSVFGNSNEGFLLCLYETIYENADEYLCEGKVINGQGEQIPFVDTFQERKLRINRLVEDGYVLKHEVDMQLDRKTIAGILYRIYKEKIPFKGSVKYSDTENIAMRWAGEVGLPTYAFNSGNSIRPEETIANDFYPLYYPYDYAKIIMYAYLLFPNPRTGNYLELDFITQKVNGIKVEEIKTLIDLTRKEVTKSRLGDFKRDVIKNSNVNTIVTSYLNTKSERTLEIIYDALRKSYNLFEYQDNLDYIRYMFKITK